MPATAFTQIGQIASLRRVHEAFQWLHLHEQQIMRWQMELVAIAAPPFGEQQRAEWLLERFRELGLQQLHLDSAGNALATLPRRHELTSGLRPQLVDASPSAALPLVLLSAHIDTVFPADTPLATSLESGRLSGPGACDNGAGVVGLLALAAALTGAGVEPECDIVFAGNVGEEGEGDLRGMRQIYQNASWRHRIAAHLVLDGAGHEVAVTGALGSRRFEVNVRGSGGHSWTDAGRPNPVITLCAAIAAMGLPELAREARNTEVATGTPGQPASEPAADVKWPATKSALSSAERVRSSHSLLRPLLPPHEAPHSASLQPLASSCTSPAPSPRSTWNVGMIEGGGAINTIPGHARARFDLRSTDADQLVHLEVKLHRVIEDAVLAANAEAASGGHEGHALSFTIESIGSRPSASLKEGARILELLRGVDRHLNLHTQCRTASTDANIPLSLGVEAISIGAGGDGGGTHTRGEWYDARGRDLGLRRVLLLLLALASEHGASHPHGQA